MDEVIQDEVVELLVVDLVRVGKVADQYFERNLAQ